ncbi:MAG: hypothetical protein BWY42_00948 [Candidatus Omnitrophica bacterium ADurb.Bin277]|nr:MAG: hypothetical protein BWY42_00948 [Candidatus Omnitrophica bacterium ADurb.Bin277]
MTSASLEDRVAFLEKKNKELKLELKKKDERLNDLNTTIKVLRRLNGESHNG